MLTSTSAVHVHSWYFIHCLRGKKLINNWKYYKYTYSSTIHLKKMVEFPPPQSWYLIHFSNTRHFYITFCFISPYSANSLVPYYFPWLRKSSRFQNTHNRYNTESLQTGSWLEISISDLKKSLCGYKGRDEKLGRERLRNNKRCSTCLIPSHSPIKMQNSITPPTI